MTATEYEFALSANPTTDTTEINFINDGEEEHALVFAKLNEGFTVDEAFELEGKKGSAVQLRIDRSQARQDVDARDQEADRARRLRLALPDRGSRRLHYKLGQLEEFEIG